LPETSIPTLTRGVAPGPALKPSDRGGVLAMTPA
jgi:hypothetical protein